MHHSHSPPSSVHWRRFLILTTLAFTVSCAADPDSPPDDVGDFITVNGVQRSYRLFAPSQTGTEPMPLLIGIHGGGGRNEPFPQESDFQALAESQGFLMVFPLAELLAGNEGEWQLNTAVSSRHDLDFIEALIDDLGSRYTVDDSRIYAMGYSLGSMFTYELACHLSSRFAAIASHAGTMPVSPNSCAPEENVALLHLHGVQDSIIPYDQTWDWKEWDEVGTMQDIPSLLQFWSQQANCQNQRQEESMESRHIIHENCDQDVRIEHHRLANLGHNWPESINGESTHQLVWSFVSGFSKP